MLITKEFLEQESEHAAAEIRKLETNLAFAKGFASALHQLKVRAEQPDYDDTKIQFSGVEDSGLLKEVKVAAK